MYFSGGVSVAKPYTFISVWAIGVTKPFKFIGFGVPAMGSARLLHGGPSHGFCGEVRTMLFDLQPLFEHKRVPHGTKHADQKMPVFA